MNQYNPESYPPVEEEPTRENPRLAEELKRMLQEDQVEATSEASPPTAEINRRLSELDPWVEAADTLSQSRVMRNFLGMLMNSPNAPAQAQTINEALARLHQGAVDKNRSRGTYW